MLSVDVQAAKVFLSEVYTTVDGQFEGDDDDAFIPTLMATTFFMAVGLALKHPDYARSLFLAVTPEQAEYAVMEDLARFVASNPV